MSKQQLLRTVGVAALSATLQNDVGAAALAQDYTVVFHNPDPEYYVEGPGLARLADGSLVAVVPVVPRHQWTVERRVEHSLTHILHSGDGGLTWQPRSQLPYYSAVPWTDGGTLYLFAMKGGKEFRNEDLLLLSSGDGGLTWSAPVTLFKGAFWNCHTGMVIRDRRLYWAVDDLSLGNKRGPLAVIGDLSKDPMDPAAWRRSNAVPYPGVPSELGSPRFNKGGGQYLEPNVIDVHGRIRLLMTVKPWGQTTSGICAVLDLDDGGEKEPVLRFTQFHPFPGGQVKFCVIRDEKSRMFWSTANLVVDSQGEFPWWEQGKKQGVYSYGSYGGNDRRFLMLQYSLDGLNWFPAGCVAQAGKVSQSFMYARPVIDGEDLVIIARSSVNAPNQHDADFATFHRVRDFRRLALNLEPAGE